MMFQARRALKLFYSYAHEDEPLRDKLETALALLRRQNYIAGWHDRRITAGAEWAGQIDAHLAEADIVLLLISPDFMASDYCYEIEVKTALQRHNMGVARVVPIVLRPTDWQTSDLARLQCLPDNAQPITMWSNQDAAFENVAQGIRKIVGELQQTKPVAMDTPGAAEGRENVRPPTRRRWLLWGAAALVCLAVVWYAWSQSHTLVTQGEAWLDLGDYQRAERDFQHASRWHPFHPGARNGSLVSHVALARHDELNFRRGLAALLQSIPDNPHVRLLAGDLAYHDNRVGDALQDYQAAYARRPSLSEAYFRAGVMLRHHGRLLEAAEAFQRAMHANTMALAIPQYSNNLAFCLSKLGNLEEALRLYGQNAEHPLSALEASRLLLAGGEMTQARDAVQRAVAWLSDRRIAALAQNQGPWDFETNQQGIRLTEHRDKLCYAQVQLAGITFLLGHEQVASDMVKGVSCAGVLADVLDIVHWDLEVVRKANGNMAQVLDTLRAQLLEPLHNVIP